LTAGGVGWAAAVLATGHPLRGECSLLFKKVRSALSSPQRA
jgi:hypothetical protein